MVRDDDQAAFATTVVVVLNWGEQLKAIERAKAQAATRRVN